MVGNEDHVVIFFKMNDVKILNNFLMIFSTTIIHSVMKDGFTNYALFVLMLINKFIVVVDQEHLR